MVIIVIITIIIDMDSWIQQINATLLSKYSFDNKNPELQNILSGDGKAEIHHMIRDAEKTNCNFIIMLILPKGASIGLHCREEHSLKNIGNELLKLVAVDVPAKE